jgi:hypothetical protein
VSIFIILHRLRTPTDNQVAMAAASTSRERDRFLGKPPVEIRFLIYDLLNKEPAEIMLCNGVWWLGGPLMALQFAYPELREEIQEWGRKAHLGCVSNLVFNPTISTIQVILYTNQDVERFRTFCCEYPLHVHLIEVVLHCCVGG